MSDTPTNTPKIPLKAIAMGIAQVVKEQKADVFIVLCSPPDAQGAFDHLGYFAGDDVRLLHVLAKFLRERLPADMLAVLYHLISEPQNPNAPREQRFEPPTPPKEGWLN